jgi:hypothetical protein
MTRELSHTISAHNAGFLQCGPQINIRPLTHICCQREIRMSTKLYLKTQVFWGITLCSWVNSSRCLQGLQCPYLQGLLDPEGNCILLQMTHTISQDLLAQHALPRWILEPHLTFHFVCVIVL